MTPAMPASRARFASATSESSVCCTTPGIDAIGVFSEAFSRTNTGRMRSDGETTVSATMSRITGDVRSRRGRCVRS